MKHHSLVLASLKAEVSHLLDLAQANQKEVQNSLEKMTTEAEFLPSLISLHLFEGKNKSEGKKETVMRCDLEQILRQFKRLHQKGEGNLSSVQIENFCLTERYHFKMKGENLNQIDFEKCIKALQVKFPQLIWCEVASYSDQTVRLEFLPVALKLLDSKANHRILKEAIREMGGKQEEGLLQFKAQVQAVILGFLPVTSPSIRSPDVQTLSQVIHGLESLQVQLNQAQEEIEQHNRKKQRRQMISLLLVGGVLGLGLVCFQFFSLSQIEGNSMSPTLKNNHFVLMQKHPESVKRGEVISFDAPTLGHQRFIKRVIGLPGDQIKAVEGKVYVNDNPLPAQYSGQVTSDFDLKEVSGKERVPKNKLFVLGDNRKHSTDSRSFGFVDQGQIKGKLLLK